MVTLYKSHNVARCPISIVQTHASDGDVEAPALRDGDLVGGAGRADVGPGRRGGRQSEGEGGRSGRSVLYPAPARFLPEAYAANFVYYSDGSLFSVFSRNPVIYTAIL